MSICHIVGLSHVGMDSDQLAHVLLGKNTTFCTTFHSKTQLLAKLQRQKLSDCPAKKVKQLSLLVYINEKTSFLLSRAQLESVSELQLVIMSKMILDCLENTGLRD